MWFTDEYVKKRSTEVLYSKMTKSLELQILYNEL